MVQITTGLKILVHGGGRYDFFHDMTGLCKLDLGPCLIQFKLRAQVYKFEQNI